MIQLNLTMKQAFYLKRILDNVGGDPKGPRGQLDILYHQLNQLDGEFEALELPNCPMRGSIYFE